jgi:hypothetical protein
MSYKSLANTAEGKVLGYKGVQSDYWSTTGNADTIVIQGKTNDRHQILNEVGATIEVARRCVDDNKDNHCSFGLHVGSFDYADSWAGENGRLLLVEFDPADAVSVPTDCDFQKLRVSKYKVISDITDTRRELNKPVYEANKPIYGSNDDLDEGYEDEDNDYVDLVEDHYEANPKDLLANNPHLLDDEDDDYDMDATEDDDLESVIADYIHSKHAQGINPTINHINSLKACRNSGMRCANVLGLVQEIGFVVEENDNKTLSQLEVY